MKMLYYIQISPHCNPENSLNSLEEFKCICVSIQSKQVQKPHPPINHLLPFTAVTIPGSSEGQGQGSCDRDRVAAGTQPISII